MTYGKYGHTMENKRHIKATLMRVFQDLGQRHKAAGMNEDTPPRHE